MKTRHVTVEEEAVACKEKIRRGESAGMDSDERVLFHVVRDGKILGRG